MFAGCFYDFVTFSDNFKCTVIRAVQFYFILY